MSCPSSSTLVLADEPALATPDDSAFAKWCRSALGPSRPSSEEFTIVLLGQTGSGKTSLLNLLCNFPTVLQHGRDAVNGKVKDFRDVRFENNIQDTTVSKTGNATVYRLAFGALRLNIVDTPGFGDTRGQQFDKKHAAMIVNCIKELECVHAITVVISGRESRVTAQLKYVLSELCAILPKRARDNIVAVFTNTSNPLYLSFDIDVLSQFVEHTVAPERQIFVENPYVLWERVTKNTGKVSEEAVQAGLVRAFEEAGENLARFYASIVKMERLNTNEFGRLYRLRQEIEAGTLQALTALEHAQEEKKQLQLKMLEIEQAKSEEEMNREYTRAFSGKRWVFKNADRHGTFCGVKDCHSNCHAPCKMPMTFENERFKDCCAFFYTNQAVTLRSTGERDELLRNMWDEKVRFNKDEDDESSTEKCTVLCAPNRFKFMGRSFMAGAIVRARCKSVWLAGPNLKELTLPADVVIADQSDQDTCNLCGHHRQFHYHDSKIWEEQDYTEEVVDEECKRKYFAAKDLREMKEVAMRVIKEKIATCEQQQQKLSHQLLANIRLFEQHGLSRNYGLLLQNQRDLLQQRIDATLEGEADADVTALREAHVELCKQLEVVQKSLQKGSNEVEWARVMLGLGRGATLEDVEKAHRAEALRCHPDKHGGNPERMVQLNDAFEVLRKHVASWINAGASMFQ